jgi:asparagine synthase (glutamine-hydrolysing)
MPGGERCVDRFKGMFAFVLHERDSDRVVMARDRFGIKPLYIAEEPGRLRFASSVPGPGRRRRRGHHDR